MSELERPYYKSKNSKQTKQRLNALLNQKKYAYDASSDSVYSDYTGNVRRNALTGSLQTASYGNRLNAGDTFSDRVSNQSFHRYTSNMNQKVPELAELDFQKYQANRQNDYNALNALAKKEQTEYGRYRDDMNQYWKEREFELQKAKDAAAQAKAAAAAAEKQAKADAKAAAKAAKTAKGGRGRSGGGSTQTTTTEEPKTNVFPWEDPSQARSYDRTLGNSPLSAYKKEQNAKQERNDSYIGYMMQPGAKQEAVTASAAMLGNAEADVQARADRLRELLKNPSSAGKQEIQKELNAAEKKLDQYQQMRDFREGKQEQESEKKYESTHGVKQGSLKSSEDYDKAIEKVEREKEDLEENGGQRVVDKWKNNSLPSDVPDSYKEKSFEAGKAQVQKDISQKEQQIMTLTREKVQRDVDKKIDAEMKARAAGKGSDGKLSDVILKSVKEDYKTDKIDGQIANIDKELAMTPAGEKSDRLLQQKNELEKQRTKILDEKSYAEEAYVDRRVDEDMAEIRTNPDLQGIFDDVVSQIESSHDPGRTEATALAMAEKKINAMNLDGKRIVDSFQRDRNKNLKEERLQSAKDFSDKYFGVPATLASVGANLENQIVGAKNVLYNAGRKVTGSVGYPVDYNANENLPYGSTIRGRVGENIENAVPGYAGKGLNYLYQGVTSAADSAASVGLYGPATTVMFATGAADDSYAQSIEKGLPHDQAVETAFTSGFAEWAFETFELEGLKSFQALGAKSKGEFFINMLKQAANEGTGEMLTDLFNEMSDRQINGYFSSYYDNVVNYMDSGMSFEEAKSKAASDFGKQVLESGAIGAISGFGMGGVFTEAGNIAKRTVNDIKTGKTLDTDTTIIEGMEAPKGSEAELKASELADKRDSGKKVSARELGALKRLTDQATLDQETADAVAEVLGKSEATDSISKAITTGKVSYDEAKAILGSEKALDVVKGTTGIELTAESSVKDVQEAVAEMAHADIDADRVFAAQNGFTRPMLNLVKDAVKNEGGRKAIGTAVEVDGSPAMITGIERKNGEITVQVDRGNGPETVSVSDIQAEGKAGEDLMQLIDYSSRFRDSGVKGFIAGYDGSITPEAYYKGYSDYYRAGQENYNNQKAFDDVKSPFGMVIPESVRSTAFFNGMNDAKADLDARETRVAKARNEEVQRREEGKKRDTGVELNGHHLSESELKGLQEFSEMTGRKIKFVDMEEGRNAFIKDGVIYISKSAKNPSMYASFHEYTHYCKSAAPTLYEDYKNTILNHMRKNDPAEYERLYNVYRKSYDKIGQKLTEDEIMEEIVCDATVAFVNDAESFRDAIAKDRTFGQKVSKFLHDMAEWLRETFSGNKQHTASEYLAKNADLFEEAAQKWARMAEVASVVDMDGDTRNSLMHDADTYSVNQWVLDNNILSYKEYGIFLNKKIGEIRRNEGGLGNISILGTHAVNVGNKIVFYDDFVNREISSIIELDIEESTDDVHAIAMIYEGVLNAGQIHRKGIEGVIRRIQGVCSNLFGGRYDYRIYAKGDFTSNSGNFRAETNGKHRKTADNFRRMQNRSGSFRKDGIGVDVFGEILSSEQLNVFDGTLSIDKEGRLNVYKKTGDCEFVLSDEGTDYLYYDNPLTQKSTDIKKEHIKTLIDFIKDIPDYIIGKYDRRHSKQLFNEIWDAKLSDSEIIERTAKTFRVSVPEIISLFNAANSTTFDALVGNTTIVLSEEQSRKTTDKKPRDFYYDRKDIWGRFSINIPVEEVGDLIAVHNLDERKLLSTLSLGGFPMPSIAVTKASLGHTNFGDITVMFRGDTVDPKKNRKNKVYGADGCQITTTRKCI